MKDHNVSAIALKDIRDELFKEHKKENIFSYYNTGWGGVRTEVWFCFGKYLYTAENSRLNQQLGLWSINKKNSKYTNEMIEENLESYL
jgi:hypothetical protein